MAASMSGPELESTKTTKPVCALCDQFERLQLCGACRQIWYCCKEHQVSHWRVHKPQCREARGLLKTQGGRAGSRGDQASVARSATHSSARATELTRTANGHDNEEQMPEKRTGSASGAVGLSNRDASSGKQTQYNSKSNESSSLESQLQANMTISGDSQSQFPDHSAMNSPASIPGARKMRTNRRGARAACSPVSSERQRRSSADNISHSQTIEDYVVKCLNDYGICVVDDFLGGERSREVLDEVITLHKSGALTEGQLALSRGEDTSNIRGDQIAWVECGDKGADAIGNVIQRIDGLVMKCNGRLGRYNINGRTKAMVACYPGNGTYYMRHVDNPNEDGRCVTCIYYLNPDWDVAAHGGLLRIFPSKFNQVADIEPRLDRLLFFWSDRRNPHEVHPAHKTRYAITVWFFDAEERFKARLRYNNSDGTENARTPSHNLATHSSAPGVLYMAAGRQDIEKHSSAPGALDPSVEKENCSKNSQEEDTDCQNSEQCSPVKFE